MNSGKPKAICSPSGARRPGGEKTGRTVWSAVSALDLETLLPTERPRPLEDCCTLPGSVLPGDYALALSVTDAARYLPPLALAIRGRAGEGYYPLGAVRVSGPPPC